MVIDAFFHAADDFHLIDGFDAHAEVVLNEFGVDDGTADAHADGTDLEIGFVAHGGCGDSGTAEPKELFTDVIGNPHVICFHDILAVNTEGGEALLGIGCEDRCQIDGTGTLGGIHAPDSFDGQRIHIHGFGTVAPAGSNRQGDGNTLFAEFRFAGGCLCHASDGGVCNDDLYGLAIGIPEIFFKELLCGLGHAHGLVFQGFTYLQRSSASVDNRTDADGRILTNITIFGHKGYLH